MGKNQNTFEKRRREIEKKQRAEEKRKRRQIRKTSDTELPHRSASAPRENDEDELARDRL